LRIYFPTNREIGVSGEENSPTGDLKTGLTDKSGGTAQTGVIL
jgi:hypothetical protein